MLLYSTKEFSEISKMVKNISLKDTDKFTVLNIKNLLSSSFCTEKKFKLIEIEFYLKLDKFENSIMSKVDLVRILINFYLSLKDKDQIAFYKKKSSMLL